MTACKDGKCLTASVLGCPGPTRKHIDCAFLMRRARIRSGLLTRICEISRWADRDTQVTSILGIDPRKEPERTDTTPTMPTTAVIDSTIWA
jgi:hypothetical protein